MTVFGGATVVLDDDFSGTAIDTNKWNVLDTTAGGAGTADVALDGSGQLNITLSNGVDTYYYNGLQSKNRFSVTGSQKLIVDVYGTNVASGAVDGLYAGKSYPLWFLSPTLWLSIPA